ncbi:MAG: hypothetical protein ACXVZU_04620 [Methanobacteriaceae archaeon]
MCLSYTTNEAVSHSSALQEAYNDFKRGINKKFKASDTILPYIPSIPDKTWADRPYTTMQEEEGGN